MIKPSVGKYVLKRHINPSLDEIFETNIINLLTPRQTIINSNSK